MGRIKFIFVSTDDWEGIYIDGELEYEGHQVPTSVWLSFIDDYRDYAVESYWVNEEYMHDMGNFPDEFEDIPKEVLSKT